MKEAIISNSTIDARIENINHFIKNNDSLVSLLDIDINKSEDNVCNDTRIILQKKLLDFVDIMEQVGGDNSVEYIKSGSTGHVFKLRTKDNLEYAIKFCPFPKTSDYGDIYDVKRPENAEIKMIKVLSKFVLSKETPHIALPISCFDTDIKPFVHNDISQVADSSQYKKFIQEYENGEFYKIGSILISEFADRGDLLDFLKRSYNKHQFTLAHWTSIFFQVLSVLAVIQAKYSSFRHNNLKPNNILIQKIGSRLKTFSYKINKKIYSVPNIGYHTKLCDFDFSCIPGIVDNDKVCSEWAKNINITPVQNRYIDIHFFFIKLITLLPLETDASVPLEVKEFIKRVLPNKYRTSPNINDNGRLLVNDEYITPQQMLEEDPFFASYRVLNNDKPSSNEPIS